MVINVKMSTIVGIFTFISMTNTSSERLTAKKVFIFQRFCFMSYEGGSICNENSQVYPKVLYLHTP